MATPRKRSTSSPGFSQKEPDTSAETASIEEFLEENAREMFETISRIEEEVKVEVPRVEAEPPRKVVAFIPQEIIPTEDAGPRFVDSTPATPAKPKVEAPVLKAPPKRHPRNVPRFSARK